MTGTPTPRHDASEIARALNDRIVELAPALLGNPTSRSPSEWRWGTRGSFAIEVRGPKRGFWMNHECGQGGDALDLVVHAMGGTRGTALVWARRWLGQEEVELPRPARRYDRCDSDASEERDRAQRVALAARLWREAAPAAGTLVEVYLRSRGLVLPADAGLRFHASCPRGAQERLPAMLARLHDAVTGEACGIHRTFLRPDGAGKADGQAKMALGRFGSTVIRLIDDDEVTGLGLAEGIENAIAVMQRGWRPVWAAGSAGNIRSFPVLDGVESLTIFADPPAKDRGVGLQAAEACARRWTEAGREARVITPRGAGDWNDELRGATA